MIRLGGPIKFHFSKFAPHQDARPGTPSRPWPPCGRRSRYCRNWFQFTGTITIQGVLLKIHRTFRQFYLVNQSRRNAAVPPNTVLNLGDSFDIRAPFRIKVKFGIKLSTYLPPPRGPLKQWHVKPNVFTRQSSNKSCKKVLHFFTRLNIQGEYFSINWFIFVGYATKIRCSIEKDGRRFINITLLRGVFEFKFEKYITNSLNFGVLYKIT